MIDEITSQAATAKRHQKIYMKTFTKITGKTVTACSFIVKSRVENKPESYFYQNYRITRKIFNNSDQGYDKLKTTTNFRNTSTVYRSPNMSLNINRHER